MENPFKKKDQNAEKVAESEPSLISEFSEDQEKAQKKRGRGRPKKEVEPEVKTPELKGKFLAPFFDGIFKTVARRSGEHWELNKTESMALGNAAAPILNKYLPSTIGRFGEEIALIALLSEVISPRVVETRKLREKEQTEQPEIVEPLKTDKKGKKDKPLPPPHKNLD